MHALCQMFKLYMYQKLKITMYTINYIPKIKNVSAVLPSSVYLKLMKAELHAETFLI